MMTPTAIHDPLPEPAPVGQTAQLKQRVQELEQQVLELQRKLDALHGTDLNSLKRAYTTIAQHIQALDVDSRHISGLVSDFETSMLTPNFIAQEVGILASAATAVYVLDRGFRMVRLPLAGALSQAVIVSALGVLSWRLVMSSGAHVRNFFQRNKAAKQQLQLDWEAVRRRVEIMVQLTAT